MRTLLLCVFTAIFAAAAPPKDVFRAGEDYYKIYRIPGIVVTSKGTLLAYCEARRSESDWAAIDPVLRRSTDGGKTWSKSIMLGHTPKDARKNPLSPAKKNAKSGEFTINSPVMIAEQNGSAHFVHTFEDERAFYRRSDDDGTTWSEPVEITAAFQVLRKSHDWKVIATGPGHGLRLKNGRLLIPVWFSTGSSSGAHRPSSVTTLFSDDGGKTWNCGDVAVLHSDEFVNPSETVAEQLSDGRVLLNVRSESKPNRRLQLTSSDGSSNWSKPVFVDDLVEPICFGSLLRYNESRLLFCNPANLLAGSKEGAPGRGRDRKNLTLHISTDDGKTWPKKMVLDAGYAAYSDLARGPDGTLYILYERCSHDGKRLKYEALSLIAVKNEELPR